MSAKEATFTPSRNAPADIPTVALAIIAAILTFRWKLNTAWLVGAGAVVGLLAKGLP